MNWPDDSMRATFLGVFLKVAKSVGYDANSLALDMQPQKVAELWRVVNPPAKREPEL